MASLSNQRDARSYKSCACLIQPLTSEFKIRQEGLGSNKYSQQTITQPYNDINQSSRMNSNGTTTTVPFVVPAEGTNMCITRTELPEYRLRFNKCNDLTAAPSTTIEGIPRLWAPRFQKYIDGKQY